MPLHTDFRPSTLSDFLGNEDTIKVLENFFNRESKSFPHAFLFSGPRGCGKTTLARIVANELGCNLDYDFMEHNAATFRGIDTVREIRKKITLKPLAGPCRVWFLDECHQLTKDAQEALLKDVETPPDHAYFIFSTTDPQDLKPTLVDRCVHLTVSPLSREECLLLLRKVCRKQRKRIPVEVLEKIVESSEGRPRTSLVLLEQVLDLSSPEEMLKVLKQHEELEVQIIDLCRALMKRASWNKITSILKKLDKEDPETIRRSVLGYCSAVLMNGDDPRAYEVMAYFIEPFYNTGRPGLIFACYSALGGE